MSERVSDERLKELIRTVFITVDPSYERCKEVVSALRELQLLRQKDYFLCKQCDGKGTIEDDGRMRNCPVCDGDPKIDFDLVKMYSIQMSALNRKLRESQDRMDDIAVERNTLRQQVQELREAWEETNITFRANLLEWYPKLHTALDHVKEGQ